MAPKGHDPAGYGTAGPALSGPHRATAVACGLGAGLGGALAWGVLAYYVPRNLDLLGVLLGPLVGWTVARLRPHDLPAAAGSAVSALVACVLGRFLVELFGLAGVGVTIGSLAGHLGLIARGYRFGIGVSLVASWAIAAGLAFWIPLRWPARPRTPAWRR